MNATPKRHAARPATFLPPADARCIAYVRVSSEEQAREDRASLPEQERECRALAAQRRLVVEYVWRDEGVSGRDEARLEGLTAWCETHPRAHAARGLIVIAKASRWGRFTGTPWAPFASSHFKYRLARAGWDVESVEQPSTGNRTTDGVLAVIHDSKAAAESEEKESRSNTGGLNAANRGRWQGRPPFGFARVAVSEGGRERPLDPFEHAASGEHVKLVPGTPRDVRTVRMIFQRFRDGASLTAIADALNTAKTPGPFDVYAGQGKGWVPRTVATLLRNPAYRGDVVWRRRMPPVEVPGHSKSRDPKQPRKSRRYRPRDEWVGKKEAHPPLVDKATFEAVQRRFARRTPRQAPGSPFVLTGFVVCRTCGQHVVGSGPTHRRGYRCHGAVMYPPRCPKPTLWVEKQALERQVWGVVAAEALKARRKGQLVRAVERYLAPWLAEQSEAHRAAWADRERERRRLEARLVRLEDDYLDGTFSKERYLAKRTEIETTLVQLGTASERVALDAAGLRAILARAVTLTRKWLLPKNFLALLDDAPHAIVRELLSAWLDGPIMLDKTRRRAEGRVRCIPVASDSDGSPLWPGGGFRFITGT